MDLGGIDIADILSNGKGAAAGAVAVIVFFLKRYVARIDRKLDTMDDKLDSLEDDIYEVDMKTIEVEKQLIGLGVDELKVTLKELEEFRIEKTLECKALWRAVDPPKRASDNDLSDGTH